jgi:cytochrome c biogenesis protein CcdA
MSDLELQDIQIHRFGKLILGVTFSLVTMSCMVGAIVAMLAH